MKKVKVIAECGINHNGDINLALEMIKYAKLCNVDLVKFQKRTLDRVYSFEYLESPRESPWGKTQREQKKGLEFEEEDYNRIDEYCKKIGIEWFASAWDLFSIDFLGQYNLNYNKVASPMLTHIELLHKIAKQKKHTFISTGMSTLEEIQRAIWIFKDNGCSFELMHCNSSYPCSLEDTNLRMIETLWERFGFDVGFSDHSTGIITSIGAVMLGATSIERHFTLDRASYGSDQSASLEPVGLKKMVEYIRALELAMGDGVKRITEKEEKIKAKLRRYKDY